MEHRGARAWLGHIAAIQGTCQLDTPPSPGCCHPRPTMQSRPLFTRVSVELIEHFSRALWKSKPASGQGCPEPPVWEPPM